MSIPYQQLSCPNTEQYNDCSYFATIFYSCPAGYYCLLPSSHPVKCVRGFMCLENSQQPTYCPAKYHCSEDGSKVSRCPPGFICPMGTVSPIPCLFGNAPEGSDSCRQDMLLGFFFFGMLVLFYLIRVVDRYRLASMDRSSVISFRSAPQFPESKLRIKLDNISYRLKSVGDILQNINGKVESGQLVGILGPSGCGKSTLLSIMSGQLSGYNGRLSLERFDISKKNLNGAISIGFVPQEDVMCADFTVYEVLLHSARTRLPFSYSHSRVREEIIRLAHSFKISDILFKRVGDLERRGLSGGQKKRVSIAIEVVSNPDLLFLDEPTSGLDSVSTREICNILANLAHEEHKLIVAVIHSPSVAAFEQFDRIMLIGGNGQLLYFGDRGRAARYFQDLGCARDVYSTDPDFLLDVSAGNIGYCYPRREEWSKDELAQSWKSFTRQLCLVESDVSRDSLGEVSVQQLSWHRRNRHNMIFSCLCLSKRATLQLYRNNVKFILSLCMHAITGLVLSFVTRNFVFLGSPPKDLCRMTPAIFNGYCKSGTDLRREVGMFLSLAILYFSSSSGSAIFTHEKVLYWRERVSGLNTVIYYLTKVLADLPRIALSALCFTIGYVYLSPSRTEFPFLFLIILLFYIYSFSIGYFIGCAVDKNLVGVCCTGCSIILSLLLSGVSPSLDEVQTKYFPAGFLWSLSGPRWFIEVWWLSEQTMSDYSFDATPTMSRYDYDIKDIKTCLWALVAASCLWHGLAMICLKMSKQR